MESVDDGVKVFVGGLSWETTEERLQEHFGGYGEVTQVAVMRDKATGRPRGFGFVAFADPAAIDRLLLDAHTIDGRNIEVKRAISREEQQAAKAVNPNVGHTGGSTGNSRTKKIFVGGLPSNLTEEEFRQYFQHYGTVTDVVVMYDQNTQRSRGFGFISYDSEDAVDRVLHKTFHDLNGKQVEVKRALPRDMHSNHGSGRAGGGSRGHSGSGGNGSHYDGRGDGGRYMQPHGGGGGYPAYSSGGYGAPVYGYASSNPSSGYGNFGVGAFGGASAGYGGSSGYGGPNAGYVSPMAASGFQGVPPGASRGPWGHQAASAVYNSGGYGGSTGYGGATAWNNTSGGNGPTGQTLSANAGYGSQGYGYGGYGSADGSYGNQGGYGYSGQTAGANGAGGYGGGADNPGYSNSWRSGSASQGNALSGRSGPAQAQGGGYGGPASGGSSDGTPTYGRQAQ